MMTYCGLNESTTMAVIDETWELVRHPMYRAELIAHTPDAPDRSICELSDLPNEEDGKLLASVPELLRRIRELEQQLAEARDG